MKLKIISGILLGLFLSCVSTIQHDPTDKILLTQVIKKVKEEHFQPRTLNDQLSEEMFEKYLVELDPQKVFFTQDDLFDLQVFKHLIDDQLKDASFDFFDLSFAIIKDRIKQTENICQGVLAQNIDLNSNEEWETDPSKLNYAPNDAKLKQRWQLKVKHSLLTALSMEEKLNPNLSLDQQKNNALAKVKQQYANHFSEQKDFSLSDRLHQYIKIYLRLNDFQSGYFSLAEKKQWDAMINQSFVGVGIRYEIINQYPTITNVTIGGPVWKSKKIEAGDVILKLKTKEENPIDLYALSSTKVSQLLKGEKGSSLTLTIKKSNDKIVEVPIIRDQFTLELATSLLLTNKANTQKIGYIKLPRFYGGEVGSAAHILAELRQLRKDKVDGIIFDIRDNKGGRANEARDMLGFFLEEGIVMQSMRQGGDHNTYLDEDGRAFYKGELIVLVNERSGSGSELFSGTLQDYDRAVIVGGNATVGKGTMQNFFNLETEIDSVKYQFGEVKLTVGKFYSASGRSPQYVGVIPDIILPDNHSFVTSGQRLYDNPFSEKEIPIKACQQSVNTNPNLKEVMVKSKQRVAQNERFILATEKAKGIQSKQENSTVNLNYSTYSKNAKAKQLKDNSYQNIFSPIDDFSVSMSAEDLSSTDSAFLEKQNRLIQKLKGDPYLYECFQIMEDLRGS